MNPLEREKGITIKMQPVRMAYTDATGKEYCLNLIDTPGHVDFTYEVSRALACVEGAILLVDATQGVQAQTLANLELAKKEGLTIIPVINKIDLPSAMVAEAEEELSTLLSIPREEILRVSAKDGTGVEKLLEEVIRKVPPPNNEAKGLLSEGKTDVLRALIFDSFFDAYQGIIAYVRIFNGSVKKNEKIYFSATNAPGDTLDIGFFSPQRNPSEKLNEGEIGYIATGIKEPALVRVGDTIIRFVDRERKIEPLAGYKEPMPVVYSSIYPENQDDYELLRDSLFKLKLNDSSIFFEPEKSEALGRGFRAGFLGMLHMEIVSERLRREYDLTLVFSNPSVAYRVTGKRTGEAETIYSAIKMPDSHDIEHIEEPWIHGEIVTPPQYLGSLTSLINDYEGAITETANLAGDRLRVLFKSPLREIIIDFYDKLKSVSQGFASMAYEITGYREADLTRLDILVAGERKGILSEIISRKKAEYIARARVNVLKDILPKALFSIALQASVDGRVVARETIPAMRKDVTGYLYGGDRTRKMKLWKKQKEGKKKLKDRGSVEITPETFLKIIKKRT
jgi:GTP-binding protein LepA